MRMKGRTIWLLICLIPIMFSCAPTRTWTSVPTVQTTENAVFSARLEPLRWGQDVTYFNAFRLTVSNKTDDDLEIDWTHTLYLINGHPDSRFIWAGIGKENVNNPPPDIVSAGRNFSRIVVPLRMIAWKPLNSASSRQAFTAGPLLEGRNGIDLIIRQGDRQMSERLTVEIRSR